MGVAKNIEQRLESLVEGFFAKIFRSGLQPVEVGRRILREMGENKTVSVNRVYVPNDFRVLVGPDDYRRFEQMVAGLQREFSELIIDAAKENRWNLMGMPQIEFVVEDKLGVGEYRVEASLTADAGSGPAPHVSTRAPDESGGHATRAISTNTADRLGIAQSGAELVVLDDSGEPKDRISITDPPITIGRLSGNDVVLSDPNVSRRHAELRLNNGQWVLSDLGSTNGTLVNGKLAHEQRLSDGDRLSFGSSELIFEIKGKS
jgi:hypothetical protein